MIGWIIFGCIVLFFVFLFTVHAYITMEMAEDMTHVLWIDWYFIL